MNTRETSVLILDDMANRVFPEMQDVTVKALEQFEEIDGELNGKVGRFDRGRPDLIFLDSMFDKGKRGWRAFLPRLRERFPNANIYLMSELRFSKIDEEFAKDWGNWSEIVALEELINTDSRISFFPKPSGLEALRERIEDIIKNFRQRENQKEQLTHMLVKASLLSYSALLGATIQDLCRAHFSDRKPVDPPYGFDIAVEEVIRKEFAGRVHEFGLILATEEEGMQNQIYRKLEEARFFLFSDPLDGSSALRKFLKPFAESEDWKNRDLRTFLMDKLSQPDTSAAWEHNHAGPVDFYSPTISMTLAETDRVVASVLVNLFTGKLYLSAWPGNFVFDLNTDDGKSVLEETTGGAVETVAISAQAGDANIAITALEKFDGHPQRAVASFSGKPFTFETPDLTAGYLLGQLKAKPLLLEAQATVSYEHFARNIQPLVKEVIDVDSSLQLRYARNDFSPGPARVLFLSDRFQPRECEVFIGDEDFKREVTQLLGNAGRQVLESYRLILANGEPVTEWIHWFAFLQNDPNHSLVAYRLNRPAESRWKDDVKASMAPPEVCSAFKCGYFDMRTLHSSFLEGMHRYTDTILVCRRDDLAMVTLLENSGFYDSPSRGVGVRICGALDELSRQLELLKVNPPIGNVDALTALAKKLRDDIAISTGTGEVRALALTTTKVQKTLDDLESSLKAIVIGTAMNDHALQIFVFVSRLLEMWIHPMFKQIQPAVLPGKDQ